MLLATTSFCLDVTHVITYKLSHDSVDDWMLSKSGQIICLTVWPHLHVIIPQSMIGQSSHMWLSWRQYFSHTDWSVKVAMTSIFLIHWLVISLACGCHDSPWASSDAAAVSYLFCCMCVRIISLFVWRWLVHTITNIYIMNLTQFLKPQHIHWLIYTE